MEDVEASCRKAIELDPGLATPISTWDVARSEQLEEGGNLSQSYALEPNLAMAHCNLSSALAGLQQYRLARTPRKAIELQPDLPERISILGALGWARRPSCRGGDLPQAIGALAIHAGAYLTWSALADRKQFREGGQSPQSHRASAGDRRFALQPWQCSVCVVKYHDAEVEYRKAIELKPRVRQSLLQPGHRAGCPNDVADAVKAYQKAIALNPGLALAHAKLGGALLRMGNSAGAVVACRKAIDLEPDLAEAYFELGSALSAQQEHSRAEAAWRKLIEIQPRNGPAYFNLSNALAEQGKDVEAEKACRMAVQFNPFSAQAHTNLGIALAHLGKYGEAERLPRPFSSDPIFRKLIGTWAWNTNGAGLKRLSNR